MGLVAASESKRTAVALCFVFFFRKLSSDLLNLSKRTLFHFPVDAFPTRMFYEDISALNVVPFSV